MWNFEKKEELTKLLDEAHNITKNYLMLHPDVDSSDAYRIADMSAKLYNEYDSIRQQTAFSKFVTFKLDFKFKRKGEKTKMRPEKFIPIDPEIKAAVEKDLLAGMSNKQAAAKNGVSPSSVSRIRKKLIKYEEVEIPVVTEETTVPAANSKDTVSDILYKAISFLDVSEYINFVFSLNGKKYSVTVSEVKDD